MFRYCFFENIASVAAFVGWHCSTILKPLLQQGRAMMLKLRKPWWIFLYPFLLFFFMLENKKNVRLNVIMCYLSASFYAGLLNLNPYSFQYLDQNNELCVFFSSMYNADLTYPVFFSPLMVVITFFSLKYVGIRALNKLSIWVHKSKMSRPIFRIKLNA